MNKTIGITVISVLAVALIGVGAFLFIQMGNLSQAEEDIASLESNVTQLESEIASHLSTIGSLEGDKVNLEGSITSLEISLEESECCVADLEADLSSANTRISSLQSDVSSQRTINTSLTDELKLIKDPRHFSSITELTDWLEEDDTNEVYADKTNAEKACILQVRALRDGYLLFPFIVDDGQGAVFAIIEDEYWGIDPADDDMEFVGYIDPLPSHPLPMN